MVPKKMFAMCSALLMAACGGATASQEATVGEPVAEPASGGEQAAKKERPEEEITGLLGTLSQGSIQRGIEPRMRRFFECFTDRYGEIDVLGGRFEMSFRVRRDGSVRWVFPATSTIGDRDTERCLLNVASTIRFDRPFGGEAEFTYPLELEPPEDVRPPVDWDAQKVARAVAKQKKDVLNQCRPTGKRREAFFITLYVAPGGTILAAGGAVADPELAEQVDCVIDAVRAWQMPDPGSYPAKVSFRLR